MTKNLLPPSRTFLTHVEAQNPKIPQASDPFFPHHAQQNVIQENQTQLRRIKEYVDSTIGSDNQVHH